MITLRRAGIAVVLLALSGLVVFGKDRIGASDEPPSTLLRVERRPFQRLVPAEGTLKAETATPISAPPGESRRKLAWIQESGTTVTKGQVVARFDPTELTRELEDGKTDRGVTDAKLAAERLRTQQMLESRRRTEELARLELEQAQSRQGDEDLEIFSRNEILTSRIDGKLSEARVEHANEASRIERSISRSKIELLELERKAAELAIGVAESGLAKLEVTAPHDGLFIYKYTSLKAGDLVYPGQTIAELPLVDKMEAEVFVLEADARGLEEGKKAVVIVESNRGIEVPAKIKKVDALAKPRDPEVPIQYFAVTLALEAFDAKSMKAGQRVMATLHLDAADAIVVPRHTVFTVDGENIVYRWRDDAFEAVPVKLGAGTPGLVVIEEGLEVGDDIALRDPFGTAESSKDTEPEDESKGAGAP